MRHKLLKKEVALVLFQRHDLKVARGFIATSEMEYASLRALGIRQPIAVIPNGVDSVAEGGGVEVGIGHRAGLERERIALFLSRVHPKKGLISLVHAWANVSPAGWRLRIAGPDEEGHWGEVSKLISRLKVCGKIEYVGPADRNQSAQLYRDADLFLLPTFSENFGLVVAEALSHGVPVITTRGAPWADLEAYGCGWWIDIGVEPLTRTLREATMLSDAERRLMGERGRQYVRRFNWDKIAEQTIAVYRWILQQHERPSCVRLD